MLGDSTAAGQGVRRARQTVVGLLDLHRPARIGLGAGLAYLIKNFLTNSNDQFLKKES